MRTKACLLFCTREYADVRIGRADSEGSILFARKRISPQVTLDER